jgi:hypothetical protein
MNRQANILCNRLRNTLYPMSQKPALIIQDIARQHA